MLDGWVTFLDVGVLLLVHAIASYLGGFEEVHQEVIEHHALVTKFNLAVGYKALIASSLQVDQASHHVSGSLARGKRFILSTKESARIGTELILG
jgi:hypothetical protein